MAMRSHPPSSTPLSPPTTSQSTPLSPQRRDRKPPIRRSPSFADRRRPECNRLQQRDDGTQCPPLSPRHIVAMSHSPSSPSPLSLHWLELNKARDARGVGHDGACVEVANPYLFPVHLEPVGWNLNLQLLQPLMYSGRRHSMTA